MTEDAQESIGYIIGGNLKYGLRVRLTVPASQLQEGSFVVCDSGNWRFYGLVTDLELGATDRRQADMRTAQDVTAAFRRVSPDDPVRYDFALTRLATLGAGRAG